jgi:hypothetical protein
MPRRRTTELSLRKVRSAITNGSSVLHDVDHRSAWMRRLRDLIADHVADLGGEDALSTAELALVRRAAMLTLQLELMESRWNGKKGINGPPPRPTLPAVRQAILELIARPPPQRCPPCRKWICSEKRRE